MGSREYAMASAVNNRSPMYNHIINIAIRTLIVGLAMAMGIRLGQGNHTAMIGIIIGLLRPRQGRNWIENWISCLRIRFQGWLRIKIHLICPTTRAKQSHTDLQDLRQSHTQTEITIIIITIIITVPSTSTAIFTVPTRATWITTKERLCSTLILIIILISITRKQAINDSYNSLCWLLWLDSSQHWVPTLSIFSYEAYCFQN